MGTSYWSKGLRVLSQSFLTLFVWNLEDTLTSLLISKLHFLNLIQVNQKGYDRVFLSCLIGILAFYHVIIGSNPIVEGCICKKRRVTLHWFFSLMDAITSKVSFWKWVRIFFKVFPKVKFALGMWESCHRNHSFYILIPSWMTYLFVSILFFHLLTKLINGNYHKK